MHRSRNQYRMMGTMGLLCFAVVVFWTLFYKKQAPASSTSLTPSQLREKSVRSLLDKRINLIETQLHKNKEEPSLYTELAEVCMRKARLFHDGASYLRAERACQKALEIDPHNYAAIRLSPWIYNGQHRFEEAVTAAQRASDFESRDPWNLGNLGDALIEIGEYKRAAQVIQQMVDLRPDFASYSRAAYIRELFGDPEGAIEIMGMAVRAANSRDPEQNAWSRVQLGNLYFNSGHYREARFQFQRAVDFLPEYASAYTGLARVQTAEQQFEKAISYYQISIAIVPTYDAVVGLGDLYRCQGQEAMAAKTFELLSVIEQHDRSHNIQSESYRALFYADHGIKLKEALEMVEKQAARRKDIRTWDALAWTLYKSGRYLEARAASKQAMRLGTRDALLYYHSGMIEERLGDLNRATVALKEALRINPDFHPLHAELARNEIKELTARGSLSHGKPSREG